MDMKISGAGVIGGGEYEEIKISGSARIEGSVRCESFACSGSVHGEGSLESAGDVKISGSAKVDGPVQGKSVHISGAVRCGDLRGSEEIHVSGGAQIDGSLTGGEIHLSGGVRVKGGIEAEDFRLSGSLDCPGLLNAERVEIHLGRDASQLGSIGGSQVIAAPTVNVYGTGALVSFLQRRFSSPTGRLTVRESIEADDVDLVNTHCPLVTGARVVIGRGCRIGTVRYSESLEIDPAAEVGSTEKV